MMPFYKALLVLSLATAGSIQSQTFSTLYSFPSAPVSYYPSTRVQGIDGSLYGTTSYGGLTNQGTVFKITPGGTLTTLHNFSGTDGSLPVAMIEGTEGNFYGVTEEGSAGGTVFKITPEGALTTLHSFPGDTPLYLIQGADGDFYGTTSDTVFKMTLSGTLTTLHTFTGNAGGWSLMQATNGDFYGTSLITGVGNCCGTLFKLTPSGKYTLLHTFSEAGTYPYAAMVQALNGNLYGTTSYGGTYNNGTIYELTPPGVFTTVHNFTNAEGLVGTGAALIQATSGKLYGTTYYNGVYEFTLNGTLTTVPGFSQQSGQGSCGGLVQATNGVFYGTTCFGGTQNTGVVFSLSQNLAPFVEPLPGLGAEGSPVTILGTDLTGALSVTFNGIPASFTVLSSTAISTTVPSGATTGKIEVTTPTGTLASNLAPFRITPVVSGITPTGGPVGTMVVITGTGLLKTSRVTFYNQIAATSFTVDSDTQVSVTVPSAATTGPIQVTTSGGTATSSQSFTVN